MIYIVANAYAVSGGPELAHQLCNRLNSIGFESSMLYFHRLSMPTQKLSEKLIEAYERYQCPKARKCIDTSENVVIFPEATLYLLSKIKYAQKVIWWLSVDNYYKSFHTWYAKVYAPFGMQRRKFNPFRSEYIHCYQSQYAKEFLNEHKIASNKMFALSDYLSEEFFIASENEKIKKKNNVVLYNPQKGYDVTEQLKLAAPQIEWKALINMDRTEMVELMIHSKVYIDFGNHPGKDRIPREAAMCGCCIITGCRGSAKNDIDIPIDKKYKFDDKQIEQIIDCIYKCFKEYSVVRKDFDDYRAKIRQEKEVFYQETAQIGCTLSRN